MRKALVTRQKAIGIKISDEVRKLVENLRDHLTRTKGRRYTLTDVWEEALKQLAEKEQVNANC